MKWILILDADALLKMWTFGRDLVQSHIQATLLDGTNVRLNWNIESDMNVYWI
jgi:hypothetical protein